ncbi:hypothetical protein J5491_03140 [Candidatus Saccharibacteria bacterium]|nr:hypothetical protein [Candidatus Saccharibacteria bacterium]
MNKRYIDFVPTSQKKSVETGASAGAGAYRAMPQKQAGAGRQRVSTGVRKVVRSSAQTNVRPKAQASAQPRMQAKARVQVQPKVQTKAVQPRATHPKAAAVSESTFYESRMMEYSPSGLSIDDDQKLGVIENLNEKFVSKDVEKRPLSDGKPLPEKDQAKEAKSKRLIGRKHRGSNEKQPVEKSVENSVEKPEEKKKTYNVPKSPFINQEKVVKRPLSKNVYTKKAEPSKEEHGPVTIISKPEKENRIGIVVAVILIIILGAAAGTVAFLLLPK